MPLAQHEVALYLNLLGQRPNLRNLVSFVCFLAAVYLIATPVVQALAFKHEYSLSGNILISHYLACRLYQTVNITVYLITPCLIVASANSMSFILEIGSPIARIIHSSGVIRPILHILGISCPNILFVR